MDDSPLPETSLLTKPLQLEKPLRLQPLQGAPVLDWRVPGSKSITNRALVLAGLADGTTRLHGALDSDDTRHMVTALRALGIDVEQTDDEWRVAGGVQRLRAPAAPLFVGNSGTTVRFLTALAALVPGSVRLEGDAAMARRPIADLVSGLQQLGVHVECPSGCPPLSVRGEGLAGGTTTMRGDRSSQYFSALMMAALGARSDVTLHVEGELVSRPYIAITERLIAAFGGHVELHAQSFVVHPSALRARAYTIEPDASAASYAFALAAGSGGSVTVPDLGENALQGDYAFTELLERAGAQVRRSNASTTVTGTGKLRGIDVDMHHISDTVMTLAALAVVAEGRTTIRNVANIRIKETDRLLATVTELRRLGQHVEHGEDWLAIEPRPLQPAQIHCYDDHRMAMSFGVLGALRAGITIEDPKCVSKTYPGFWHDLGRAYAAVGQPFVL